MIKRSICLIVSFSMVLTQAIAQSGGSKFLSLNNSAAASVYYERHYEVSPNIQYAIIQNRPGERLRSVGITLLCVGGGLVLLGTLLVATSPVLSSSRSSAVSYSSNNNSYSGPSADSGFGLVLGVAAIGHGIASLIAGGVLTGIGAGKMKNSKEVHEINE